MALGIVRAWYSRDKCVMPLRVQCTGSVVENSRCRFYINNLRGWVLNTE
jgi:hypothetical protein